jgi:phenylalanyl-tRNA synthetase beta chain
MELRRACVAQGLHEARSLTLVPAQPLGLAFTGVDSRSVRRVKNPMIDDQVVLRPNLLHGLLAGVSGNVRAGSKVVRLFEIGRVYSAQAPEESTHLALVVSGAIAERSWRATEASEIDLFRVKGMLAAVLGDEVSFDADNNPALALSITVKLAGKVIGWVGQLWPADARALDATTPVLFAEVDLAVVFAVPEGAKRYRDIPKFPAAARDIAVVAASTVSHDELLRVLRDAKEPLLTDIELFDVFTDPRGEKLPADKKSLAYSLTYRAPDRTLTADEVNAAHARLKERLKSALGVTLRE